MKTLRVFYVVHKRVMGSTTYKKIKGDMDFPDRTPEEAYEFLQDKHGKFAMDERTCRAPDEWVEINSHTYVDPEREKVVLPTERVLEQSLFSPVELKEMQCRKPETGLMWKRRTA